MTTSKNEMFPSFLRVGGISHKYFSGDNANVFAGLEVDFLKVLSGALKFNYSLRFPLDKTFGSRNQFGNWSGLVAMLLKNEIDIGMSGIGITEERFSVIDFTIPYFQLDKTFAINFPKPVSKAYNIIYPFSGMVWIGFFMTLVIMVILFKNLVLRNKSFTSILLVTISSLLKFSASVFYKSNKYRFIIAMWLLYATFTTNCYTSVLPSFLLKPTRMRGVRNIQELYDTVLEGKYKYLLSDMTIDLDYLLQSNLKHFRGLGEQVLKNNWFYQDNDPNLKDILDDNTAVMGPRLYLDDRFNDPPYDIKYISDDSFGFWNLAIGIRKGFCCKSRLNTMVGRIVRSGIFLKIRDDNRFKNKLKNKSKYVARPVKSALTVEDLFGAFLILGIGYTLALIIFLLEVCCKVTK